jgi:peptidoglycan/LPS O-acetylase OafA/YrhL
MSLWSKVRDTASRTPADRNRYVDLLRAVSITVVVIGHWLIVAVQYDEGSLSASDLLVIDPGLQWLTWLFQVMPIFFIVGGYSNAASLESASRNSRGYGEWLAGRLNRLVSPLLLLVLGWGSYLWVWVAVHQLGFAWYHGRHGYRAG